MKKIWTNLEKRALIVPPVVGDAQFLVFYLPLLKNHKNSYLLYIELFKLDPMKPSNTFKKANKYSQDGKKQRNDFGKKENNKSKEIPKRPSNCKLTLIFIKQR
jgi:hypothetical protein